MTPPESPQSPQQSSPTCYQTADSADTSVSSGKGALKRSVKSLVTRFDNPGNFEDQENGEGSVISSSSSQRSSSAGQTTNTVSTCQGQDTQDSQESQESRAQRQQRKLYESAREVMTSEKTFVEVLNLIGVEFRTFIENKMKNGSQEIIPLQEFSVIFRNLPQLLTFNEELLRDFEDRIENWDSVPKIADVFIKKGPFLKLHKTYIDDFEVLTSHFNKCCQTFPKFKKAVAEFESLPQCKSLKISFYMLKPVQRIPQYRMLLENYMKYLPEDSVDFDDTTEALRIVNDVASHCNTSLFAGVSFGPILESFQLYAYSRVLSACSTFRTDWATMS